MAYQKGDTITISELNGYLSTINSVFGTGNGTTGYGQTSLQAAVNTGDIITSAHWTNFRSMIATCATHQGSTLTAFAPASEFVVGHSIVAENTASPSLATYDLPNAVSTVNTNRLNAAVGSMSVITGSTITRATSWSTTITCTMDVTWASEDAARYFFNTGGQIRINMSQPTTSGTPQDADWNTTLATKIAELRVGATTVAHTGTMSSLNVSNGAGFYNLLTTPGGIVNAANIGGGAYASNDVTITGQVLNRVGANGGNGTGIRFVITLADQHTGTTDTVSAGTAASFSVYKATTYMTGIATPTYTVQTGF